MGKATNKRHQRQYPLFKASVMRWYTRENWERVFPYVNGTKFSRRFLEHLITEYARSHHCEYKLTDEFTGEIYNFNIYHSAQTVLAGVHKRNMDPFGRKNHSAENDGRFMFGYGDKKCEVSVCELIFFRWAVKHNVIHFAEQHYDAILDDMKALARSKRTTTHEADIGDDDEGGSVEQCGSGTDRAVVEVEIEVGPCVVENPFRDEYWQASIDEKMLRPKKRRKRVRESAVDMIFNDDCEIKAAL